MHPDATVVAPDGTRINGTTASPFAIHPNTREGNLGAQSLGLQWIEAHAIANGARIRSTPINGTVVAVMPYGDVVWTSCRRFARDGWWWAWVAYNDWGNHWVSGWTRGDLVRMVRPYTLPSC